MIIKKAYDEGWNAAIEKLADTPKAGGAASSISKAFGGNSTPIKMPSLPSLPSMGQSLGKSITGGLNKMLGR